MDAKPLLAEVGRHLAEVGLEAVLIGNAAAALQGAPVTTVDLDFLFRRTPRNLQKLKKLARVLHATVLRPYYPVSDLFRIVRDDDGLQVDFMGSIHGIRSFESLRDRASVLTIAGVEIRVARSSSSWRRHVKKRPARRVVLLALRKESARVEREMIRRWQALPMEKRTNFLRKRVGFRASAL